jgi:MFS superfamily sulfate permease-like transporter
MSDAASKEVPRGNLAGLRQHWPKDFLSGFLVFLIALPLCLGISLACGYPAIAGIFTAAIGGVLSTFISNSELTIKGPAAGLIVIAIGCVHDFGGNGFGTGGGSAADIQAYRLALGVGVAAGVLQILFGLLRSGILGELFPLTAVHGLLAAIGIIIISTQLPICLGVDNKGRPLELLMQIPTKIRQANPEIAIIGAISLLILFGLPLIRNKYVKRIPAPMVVVLIAVPLGLYFDLSHHHTYTFSNHNYQVGEEYLVNVPSNAFGAITFPDFSGLAESRAWKWVIMFALIGTLESMLSAKAIDTIDPWKRKTNLDRDNLAIGIGNTLSAFLGGLPMISEIVRSKANIDNGARTRFSNMFHGLFLLSFVALLPALIHRIPLAALGAMLVFTGYRLASPREWAAVYKIGRGQLLVFTVTVVTVLATDLLIGIGVGVLAEFVLHLLHYPPVRSLFRPEVVLDRRDEKTVILRVRYAAVFSNWIPLQQWLASIAPTLDVIVDLSETHLVDHTVMEKLHELEREYEHQGRRLEVIGLDNHQSSSAHPLAARTRSA